MCETLLDTPPPKKKEKKKQEKDEKARRAASHWTAGIQASMLSRHPLHTQSTVVICTELALFLQLHLVQIHTEKPLGRSGFM
jgi:hypothetical protein